MATVVAIGGNALADSAGGAAEAARRAAEEIASLAAAGVPLAITHGNGPQVGRALIRAAAAEPDLPPLSMDIAVAHTQGEIGQLLAMAIERAVAESQTAFGPDGASDPAPATALDTAPAPDPAPAAAWTSAPARPIVALISRTLVAPDDPAFDAPDKPIGPWMSEVQALRLSRIRGWTVKPIGERGWRRVVASPEPREILEAGIIAGLVAEGAIVICCGGGGIPVSRVDAGPGPGPGPGPDPGTGLGPGPGPGLRGVEAVVDKDLTSALLADAIGASRLIIATDVPGVALDFGGRDERWLDRVDAGQARALLAGGHFPPGSMGPKVRAALRFVEGGVGRIAAITALEGIRSAFDGRGDGPRGTIFTRDAARSAAGPGHGPRPRPTAAGDSTAA